MRSVKQNFAMNIEFSFTNQEIMPWDGMILLASIG